ncbi:MAG TPA: hypothetical protein VFE54_01140, partial [Mucilaginibacter sp.]|nr:hypothetical protein [Mucilaginibacter sp.]
MKTFINKDFLMNSKALLSVTAMLLALTLFAACKKADTNTGKITIVGVDTTPKVKPVYALVWSDEFDEAAIDTTKWGFDLGNLHVNNEKEYYQTQNATIAGGNLVITA